MAKETLHLAFDELSHWPLAQLRRGALRDAERWGDHLAAGAIHADEVNQTGEILQKSAISWVKVRTLRGARFYSECTDAAKSCTKTCLRLDVETTGSGLVGRIWHHGDVSPAFH